MTTRPLPVLFLLLALLPAAPGDSIAQETGTRPVPVDTFTLENGLRFLVSEDHSAPVVAVQTWYDVGSAHEKEGRTGFAHLFEHLMFEETERLEEGEIDRLVNGAGGSMNATTSTDRTAYFFVLPSNRVNLALWIEAERMARLRVSAENFENQRSVVKEERRQRIENQPYTGAQLTLDSLATDYGPYDHHPIGSMDDLNAATEEDAREFYETYYVPNNAAIAVVGDVTVEAVRAMAREYFGEIPGGPEPDGLPPPTPTPRTDGERRLTVPDPLANTPLYLASFNIPPHDDPDTYALDLLSRVFSQGESSRLHQRLVREEEAALAVVAQLDSRLGPGVFFFGGLPNQGVDVQRIETLVNEEIEELKTEGLDARELEKAKNQVRAGLVRGRLQVQSKARDLQHYRLFHGDVGLIDDELDRYEAVTLDDIRRVARTYLVDENRTVVIAEPAGAASQEENR